MRAMTLALLGCLLLAAEPAPPPTAYTYRTPDGIVHYVGSEDDVPEAYRKVAKRIELTGVPHMGELDKGTATGLKDEPAQHEQQDSSTRVYEILTAILLLLLPVLLLVWLRAPRQRVPILALAIVDLGLGIYFGLQIRPGRAWAPAGNDSIRVVGHTPKSRDRVKANQVAHLGQPQPGVKAPAPGPVPAPPVSTAPPPLDPSAPGTPVRKVIKPSGAEAEPEDPEE